MSPPAHMHVCGAVWRLARPPHTQVTQWQDRVSDLRQQRDSVAAANKRLSLEVSQLLSDLEAQGARAELYLSPSATPLFPSPIAHSSAALDSPQARAHSRSLSHAHTRAHAHTRTPNQARPLLVTHGPFRAGPPRLPDDRLAAVHMGLDRHIADAALGAAHGAHSAATASTLRGLADEVASLHGLATLTQGSGWGPGSPGPALTPRVVQEVVNGLTGALQHVRLHTPGLLHVPRPNPGPIPTEPTHAHAAQPSAVCFSSPRSVLPLPPLPSRTCTRGVVRRRCFPVVTRPRRLGGCLRPKPS
jgi:hypothetical protein